jgi:hypothetical protein
MPNCYSPHPGGGIKMLSLLIERMVVVFLAMNIMFEESLVYCTDFKQERHGRSTTEQTSLAAFFLREFTST